MPLVSQPDERADPIDLYLGHQGAGTLSLALAAPRAGEARTQVGTALQRAASSVLRGGLTGWVHIGMLVRKLRGRADPLHGLGQRDSFLALCRLTQTAIDAEPLMADLPRRLTATAHVRLFATPHDADDVLERIQRVFRPYTAAATLTRSGPALIAWFAVRHLIETRARDYSLQVVYLDVDGPGGQVSLMLPRDPVEDAGDRGHRAHDPDHEVRPGPSAADTCAASGARRPPAPPGVLPRRRRGRRPPGNRGSADSPSSAEVAGLQAYLDAYRDHLTRELLLEPVVSNGSAAQFGWAPEPTGDGGVAVAGTVPSTVSDHVVLRMAEHAVAQLGERSPQSAGRPLGQPEADGDLLVQRWSVGDTARYVLSVAARSGDAGRPTQVLIHFASADPPPGESAGEPTCEPGREPAHEPPRAGPAVDAARGLTVLPLWWHSARARCDGNDVILYEMPFRGQRLRVRANDYPAEPMYTLLVGDPAAEIAAVDLEQWPSSWVRPRSF